MADHNADTEALSGADMCGRYVVRVPVSLLVRIVDQLWTLSKDDYDQAAHNARALEELLMGDEAG